jgi:LysE type translocator
LIGSIIWLYYACLFRGVQAMSIVHPLAFFTLAAIVIATPGPDTALTIRNTLSCGRAGGVCTAFGVVAGQAAWVLATAFGVAAREAARASCAQPRHRRRADRLRCKLAFAERR